MDNLRIVDESEFHIWGQEKDDLRAMAIISMIGGGTRAYGEESLFLFFDRMRCAVENRQYGIMYERASKDAPVAVPVSFITWALLSPPVATMFTERMRPMSRDEWRSGKQLWVIDMCAPYASGHMQRHLDFFNARFKDHAEYQFTRMQNSKWVRKSLRNPAHTAEE